MLFLLEEFVFVSCSEQSDLFAPGYIWEKKKATNKSKEIWFWSSEFSNCVPVIELWEKEEGGKTKKQRKKPNP